MRTKSMLAAAVTFVLAVGLAGVAGQTAAAAQPSEVNPTAPPEMPSVPGSGVPVEPPAPDQAAQAAARPVPEPVWPEAEAVTATTGDGGGVQAQVLDRAAAAAAGVDGLLMRVDGLGRLPAGESVKVSLDYSRLRNLYGGDWASRLQVVDVERETVLPSDNDVAAGELTTTVESGAVGSTFAVTAAAEGPAGDYKATELAPAGKWTVSTQSGAFTWSYDLRMPPVPGNLTPSLSLGYSSSGVDGRTASTNNQPSWIGEGWSLWPGYVERSYRSCADTEGKPATGDLCWITENAVMSLGGTTAELVREGTSRRWRPRVDDGTRVEQRFDTAANGDVRGEYWVVTTTDGVQYHYGSQPAAESTWTVPVFGDSPGTGCGGTWATSDCVRAWRWNLDHVVDPHGNVINYQYRAETNRYARNQTDSAVATYTRGGWLERIDYGHRAGEPAAAQVVFGVADRCRPGAACGTHTGAVWPDVPWDWECAGATCADKYSPTFWSTKRLSAITTRVRTGSTYTDVDRWSLDHSYPDPGDGTSAGLWLHGITHAGLVGGSQPVPPVTFAGVPLANRVDSFTDGPPQLFKYRISTIHNGSGGDINVDYAPPNCSRSALPTAHTNTLRCFPARWVMKPEPQPRDDWFHVYVVNRVTLNDRVAGGMMEVFHYDYLGGGAWRYDTNPVVAEKYRTWSQWRGYEKVQVRHGDPVQEPGRPVSLTQFQYFRGMDGDRAAPAGGTRPPIHVVDSAGTPVLDSDPLAGMLREQITFDGVGGAVVSGVINDPWTRGPTATQGSLQAFQVQTVRSVTRTPLSSGRTRRTQVDTAFDNEGNPTEVNDLGDVDTAADDRCTRTNYARNENSWLLKLPSQVTTVGVACNATPSYPADAISDVRTYYDGLAWDAAPTAGNPTRIEEAGSYTGSTAHYITAATATFDDYGRVLDSFDALARKTMTRYLPATGPATGRTVTNPLGHTVTTTVSPAWGAPVATEDANQARTDLAYDPLGRLTGVWQPGRSKADFPDQPDLRFAYTIQDGAPSWVRADTLEANGNYVTGYTLHDGFLRQRQSQVPSPKGGRVLTDTLYDSRGLAHLARGPYYQDAAPGTGLVEPDINRVPAMTLTRFDGAERPIAEIFLRFNSERWRTTTAHRGDHVAVTPPAGGTATATFTDARGQTTELWQYRGPTPTGDHDVTQYRYTKAGHLSRVIDAAGNTWRYEYDVRGRRTLAVDPDSGQAVMTYDAAGQLATITDARSQTITYDYDALGRRTVTRQGQTVLARWTYDTLKAGLLTSSTRIQAGGEYTRTITGYDAGGRPSGERVSFPGAEIGQTGTVSFTTTMTYKVDGSLNLLRLPELAADTPAETLTHTYDAMGKLVNLRGNTSTGATTYLNRATYTALGEAELMELGHPDAGPHVWQQWTYEDGTRRLATALTEREQAGNLRVDLLSYTYDLAGNVTSIKDELPGAAVDNQCFRYDYLRRMTEAWTQTGDCAAAPSTGVVGGPAPYWHTYGYDVIGNRRSLNRHGLGGAQDTVSTYTYPAAGQPRPHQVTSVQTTGAGTTGYGYNASGHTTSRPGPNGQQTLDWDAEGLLASVTAGANVTSYRYDADGGQLIRRDPGSVTVFLGDSELVYDTAARTTTGTRYYSAGDRTIAVKVGGALRWLVGDHHGTNQLAVNPATLQATVRRYDPFGNLRGPGATWPGGNHGFVDGTRNDATGLTRLGAREYDAPLGRFVSIDPLIEPTDPQQMNGYAYANNSPVTYSDPDGLIYYLDDHNASIPSKAHATPGQIQRAQDRAAANARNNRAAANSGNGSTGGKTSGNGGSKKPTFNFDYLLKHGRPHPDTDPRAYDNETVMEIVDMCAIANGDADCDPEFHAFMLNLQFQYRGYEGGWMDFVVTEGLGGMADGRGPRGNCGGRSFSSDTPVLMADGTSKPISEVEPGDEVLASDPETGEQSAQAVTDVWVHDDTLVELQLTQPDRPELGPDGDRMVTVTTTDDHPFWNESDLRWEPASSLDSGDELLSAGGVAPVVGLLWYTQRPGTAYNLTVANLHTYYVLAEDTPVLVHNCPQRRPGSQPTPPGRVLLAIANVKDGTQPQRLTPKGEPDVFTPRPNTPLRVAERWGNSKIYEVPGMGNNYRILVNERGQIGWTDNHYRRIMPYAG